MRLTLKMSGNVVSVKNKNNRNSSLAKEIAYMICSVVEKSGFSPSAVMSLALQHALENDAEDDADAVDSGPKLNDEKKRLLEYVSKFHVEKYNRIHGDIEKHSTDMTE